MSSSISWFHAISPLHLTAYNAYTLGTQAMGLTTRPREMISRAALTFSVELHTRHEWSHTYNGLSAFTLLSKCDPTHPGL